MLPGWRELTELPRRISRDGLMEGCRYWGRLLYILVWGIDCGINTGAFWLRDLGRSTNGLDRDWASYWWSSTKFCRGTWGSGPEVCICGRHLLCKPLL